jgi:hypothetical protein
MDRYAIAGLTLCSRRTGAFLEFRLRQPPQDAELANDERAGAAGRKSKMWLVNGPGAPQKLNLP